MFINEVIVLCTFVMTYFHKCTNSTSTSTATGVQKGRQEGRHGVRQRAQKAKYN